MAKREKLLFVCSANMDRSPTAERLFSDDERYEVRSAGVMYYARTQISEELIEWADKIFVMEPVHEWKLRDRWPELTEAKEIYCLKIADDYGFGEQSLERTILAKMAAFGYFRRRP